MPQAQIYQSQFTGPEIDERLTASGVLEQTIANPGDIAAVDGKLQLADREYDAENPDGLGYKILRKDATFVSQVTDTNTIYEIRYDFDLNNASVTIPAGCVLKFTGGKVSNGTMTGSLTSIEAGDVQIFDNIVFGGTWTGDMNACWIGVKKNDSSFDNSPILQSWLNTYGDYFKNIAFPTAIYYFLSPVVLSTDKRRRHILGNNSEFYVNISTDDAPFIQLIGGEQFSIRDVSITNLRETSGYSISKNTAIHFNKTHNFSMQGVSVSYFDIAVKLTDVWYGGIYGKNIFWQNRIAFFLESVVSSNLNTVDLDNPRISGCSAVAAQSIYPQNAGESEEDYAMRSARCGVDVHCFTKCVKYNGLVIEGCDFGIRYNYVASSTNGNLPSEISIEKCFFEGNAHEDIYVGRGYIYNPSSLAGVLKMSATPLIISSCGFDITSKINIYITNCSSHISGCTRGTKVCCLNDDQKSCCTYDEHVNMVSVPENTSMLIKTGQIPDFPSSTGGLSPSTMRQFVGNARNSNMVSSLLPNNNSGIDGTVYVSSGTAVPRYLPRLNSAYDLPFVKVQAGIHPNDMEFRDGKYRTFVRSSRGTAGVNCSTSQYLPCLYSLRNDGIEIHEFLRRWKAGTPYSGFVNQVFPFEVRSVPSEGKVYMKDHTGTEKLVGIGKTAIDAGFTFSTGYYIIVEVLILIFYAYSSPQFHSDLIQCGRDYSELGVSGGSTSEYNKRRFIGTTTQRDAIRPRFNAVFYNTTTKKFEIFDGFAWVELTDVFKRYIYADNGKSISQRAVVPDLPGQTYYNAATGITYHYVVSVDLWTGSWFGDIGFINSLDHPNGYDATSNPIEYATELAIGEMVRYNGNIIKWDGTGFVNLDGSALT